MISHTQVDQAIAIKELLPTKMREAIEYANGAYLKAARGFTVWTPDKVSANAHMRLKGEKKSALA